MSYTIVLLNNGKIIRAEVHIYRGACMIGDPTAYILIQGLGLVWVKPGQSGEFVEAAEAAEPQYFAKGYCYETYDEDGCVEVVTVG